MYKNLAAICLALACSLFAANPASAQNWVGGVNPLHRSGGFYGIGMYNWNGPVGWNNFYGGAHPMHRGGYYVPPTWRGPVGWNNYWGGVNPMHRGSNWIGGVNPEHRYSSKNFVGGVNPAHRGPARQPESYGTHGIDNPGKINLYR